MELSWSPSRMPKWNYIAGDLANEKSSIWSEAIAGKSRVSTDEAKVYEKNKREYIKEINNSKTQEEIEDQKTRNICSRCGKSGHMAFQCFNFLNKGNEVDPSLNELVPSDDESESDKVIKETKERSRSRSRHHSHHRHEKTYCSICIYHFLEPNQTIHLLIIHIEDIIVITIIISSFIFSFIECLFFYIVILFCICFNLNRNPFCLYFALFSLYIVLRIRLC